MEYKPEWTKVALYTAAAVTIGISIWYLSKDEVIVLDFKGKHNLENLKILLNELHLEYTCIYSRYYNAMLKLKDKNEFNDRVKNAIENDLRGDLAEKNKSVLAYRETARDDFREGLDPASLEKWVDHFKDDPEVKKLAGNIKKLHEDVFVRGKVDHIAFELPEKLDKQMYIKMYRKIWATIRHDLWARIQQEKKNLNTQNLP